jgi:hypothetical protein
VRIRRTVEAQHQFRLRLEVGAYDALLLDPSNTNAQALRILSFLMRAEIDSMDMLNTNLSEWLRIGDGISDIMDSGARREDGRARTIMREKISLVGGRVTPSTNDKSTP